MSLTDERIQIIRALFQQDLEGVSFPGVDHEILEGAQAEADARAEAVERARRALDEAQAEHAAARAELARLCELGLGYAEVYARTHPELAEALAAIPSAPEPKRAKRRREPEAEAPEAPAKRKRGRPSNAAELPFEAAAQA
ncbi:MAG: hypothetical protein KF901_22910 [Myxococcales bacterium]|nr:hypothetical protein [Myxococcales bacterium]